MKKARHTSGSQARPAQASKPRCATTTAQQEVEDLRTAIMILQQQAAQHEQQLQQVAQDAARNIANTKIQLAFTSTRLEALLRYLVEEQHLCSMDAILNAIERYQGFTKNLKDLLDRSSITERVGSALAFNRLHAAGPHVYADDLNFIEQLKAAGGATRATVKQILQLPHTQRFADFLTKLLEESKPV